MHNTIQDFVRDVLPGKRKNTANGWIAFNCPCCTDTRMRGGVMFGPSGEVGYHCFNCGTKPFYLPGGPLSYSFRKLLYALGVSDNEVKRLILEALRIRSFFAPAEVESIDKKTEVHFASKELPEGAQSFHALVEFYTLADKPFPKKFMDAVEYVHRRCIDFNKYELYWSPEMATRVIVPFYWKNSIVGYSARTFEDQVKPKFINQVDPGFVYNVNNQQKDAKIVLVVEGLFDAMTLDCVASLHDEVSEQQADIIDSLGKEVIVVPDWDKSGEAMIDSAIKYDWNVSFPIWKKDCKDVNDAVKKYGKLFVMKTILDSVESSKLKIKLKRKMA